MSDIHIGRSIFNKKKGIVNVEIFFHVPNTKDNNEFPGIEVCQAPGTTDEELVSLEKGTLAEVSLNKPFNLDDGANAIKTAIRALWQGVADAKQTELDKDYKFYGLPLDKAV